MDEIAKEYDVIVLGTGTSALPNPAMWGSTRASKPGLRRSYRIDRYAGLCSILLTVVGLSQV